MQDPDDPMVPVVVRVPRSLRDAVKDKAKTEERSMAQGMRYAMRRYVDDGSPDEHV